MSAPSLALSPGQSVAWSYATSFGWFPDSEPGNDTWTFTATSGGVTTGHGVGGSTGGAVIWTGFPTPVLPAGSVIVAIKGVAIATDTVGTPGTGSSGQNFGPGVGFPAKPYTNVLCIGTSLGTNPLDLGGTTLFAEQFEAEAGNSLPDPGGTFTGFEFLGIAVIYTPPPRKPIQTWVSVGNNRARNI